MRHRSGVNTANRAKGLNEPEFFQMPRSFSIYEFLLSLILMSKLPRFYISDKTY